MALPAPGNNSQGPHIARWNRELPPVPARCRSSFLKVLGAALTLVVMVLIFTALLRRAGDTSSPVLTPPIVPTPSQQPFSTTNNAGMENLPPRPAQELLPWATDAPVLSISSTTEGIQTSPLRPAHEVLPQAGDPMVLSPPVLSTPPRPSLNTSNSTEVLEAAPSGFTPTEPPSSTFNKTEGLEAAPSRPTQELLPSASLASMTLEAEQLPIKHASWWWSIPVVNIFRTAFLVELMWRLMAGLASFYIMHKVKTPDDCTLSYLELCFLRLVLVLCKFLRQHQDVWVPVVTHSSFVGLTTAGLVTLAVGLINVAPTNPLWAYLVIRGTLSLATSMVTSLTPDTPHSTPPSAVASTITDQPSVIAPSKPATATTTNAFHNTEMPSVDDISAPPPLPTHKRLSTSPVRGLVSAQHVEQRASEVVGAPLAHLPPLKSLPNSDAHHDEVFVGKALASTATDALDDFSFGAPTHAPTSPPLPHAKDASTGADFKGFPKLAPPLQSSPCPLPPPSCSPDTPEIIKAQPGPTLTLNPKASGKSTFTPHVPAIMRSRTPAQTTHSPSPTPLKSLMSALGGSPAAGSPLLEQPAPQTPMGSPMNWSPTPIVGDAAPKGDPNNALNPPTEAVSKTPAVLTTEPHPTEPRPTGTPLKAFFKAITPPVKSLGKAKKSPLISKAQAEAPLAKTSAKLLSPLKHMFASSAPTAQAQPDSAAPPLSSSLAPGSQGEADPTPSAALGTTAVTVASVTALPPSHSPTQASLPPIHSEVSAPAAAEADAFIDISSPTNRMASFLGTSRIPIRNPDTTCTKVSEAVLARLVSSRPSSLRQAHHRADLPQSGSVAAAKPPSRNPFAARGLTHPKGSALPPAPAPRGSLLTGRSILRRLANRGKENAGSTDHSQGQSAVVGGVSSSHNDGHTAHNSNHILDSSMDFTLTPKAAPLCIPTHTHVNLSAAQSACPDQATVHAPHKPWGFRSPVLEGTKLFKLGKLDRGKAKGVRRVGQGPKKLPPAPTHLPIRPVLPATPQGSNFNDLLMGGRQLDFDRVEVYPIGGLSYMCD